MNAHSNITATPAASKDVIDLMDDLQKVYELLTILMLAASGLDDRQHMNAFVRVAYDAMDIIEGVKDQLQSEGGTA